MPDGRGRRVAQQRADRLRIFRDELAELERQQILTVTPEQRARLDPFLDQTLADLARTFDVDVTESQRKLSLGMRLVSALGGLALCAAIVLFFIRFWGMIPTAGQVAILIATPLLGLIGMEFTSRVERTLYFTSLIGIVTFAAFVLNLAALGGIFNVTSSPNAFLAWGLLALILAYLYGLRLPMAAALVCFLVFFSGTILSWAGAWWTEFPQRPETVLLGG